MTKKIEATTGAVMWVDTPNYSTEGHTFIKLDFGSYGSFPTADLRAALGVDKLGCGCKEADDNLKAALARAEKAETELEELRGRVADRLKGILPSNEVRAILLDGPVLPTEPGSVIIATEVRGVKGEWCMALDHDGEWSSIDGKTIDNSYYHGTHHITEWKPAKVVAE